MDLKEKKHINIVSGLPRSGTSMMMQMLKAGGMQIIHDNIRKPDIDNPGGYYEYEKVKTLKRNSSWLEETCGKVFKMVSMLLFNLPDDKKYRIVFMKRNMEEILDSQRKMLNRLGRKSANIEIDKMGTLYEVHLKKVDNWVKTKDHISILYINYNDIVVNPDWQLDILNKFMDNSLDTEKMLRVIDRSLYRNITDAL